MCVETVVVMEDGHLSNSPAASLSVYPASPAPADTRCFPQEAGWGPPGPNARVQGFL